MEATKQNKVHKSSKKSPINDLFRKAVSLHKKKCIHPGCLLFASFGYRNQKKLYCLTHKPKDKKLIRCGILCKGKCGKQANFGPPDLDIKTHCNTCKPDEYVSKKKKCTIEGCTSNVVKKHMCIKHYHQSLIEKEPQVLVDDDDFPKEILKLSESPVGLPKKVDKTIPFRDGMLPSESSSELSNKATSTPSS